MTQEEAGLPVRFSVKKMSRIERGQLPDYNGLKGLLDVYGLPVNDWEPYLRLWELALEKGWWHGYGLDDQQYVSMEHEASELRQFQRSFIPGLLQTEAYARLVFATSNLSRRSTDREVEVRLRRQQRLAADPPLALHAIIDEAVLRQGAQAEVMRPQLAHILDQTLRPNVTVQVLPSAVLNSGLLGTFAVLHFPYDGDDDIGYVEHAFGAIHIESADKVRAANLRFNHLATEALSHADSTEWIERLAADL